MKKKVTISSKLTLEKTIISQLDSNQLSFLKGGAGGGGKGNTSCFSATGPGCGTSLADTFTCKPSKN